MTAVFLASLIFGIAVAVRVMMFGVERSAPTPGQTRMDVSLALPAVAAFAIVFGLAGYVLARPLGVALPATTAVAVVAGAVVALGTIRLVRRTARIMPEFDIADPRYALQGHLARVVRPISAGEDGEIAFEDDARPRVVRARSLVAATLEPGSDVVIDRIEDDVAYVEPWHEVEKRL